MARPVRTVGALATLLLAAGLVVGAPAGARAEQSCNGKAATVVGTTAAPLVGTEGRDVVVTNGASTVDTLGGTDVVCVTGALPTRIDGGDGRDRIVVADTGGTVVLDLGDGSLGVDDADATIAAFEDATIRAHYANIDGTSGPNDLRWNVCTGTMTGQRGADHLTWAGGTDLCDPGTTHQTGWYGGGDHDVLVGSPWADILVGGRGRDVADGRGGVDRCRAEVARHCEEDR